MARDDIDFGVKRRFTGKEFLKGIAEFASEIKASIDAECEGFAADPGASVERRQRVLDGDFEFFARTYFPHYVKGEPSVMHKHIFERLPAIFRAEKSVSEYLIAPRGEAKSTIVTQIGAMFAAVTGKKHLIVIIMAALELSTMMLEAIKIELESNPRLAMDFPEVCGAGRVWQAANIITANGVKLKAAGSGKRLRGMKHGPFRPDLVLLDDLENDENVENPDQRDKLDKWIDKAVVPLGPTGAKMDILYVGTVLHYDAVIVRKSLNPMWTGAKFKSIVRMPDRTDLWDRWEEVMRNQGLDEADAFYARQRDAMDAGAEVSWPSVRPIEFLMKLRVQIGIENFNCEQQNDPIDEASAVFGKITFWVNTLPSWLFYGSCDPSLGGKSRRADPSALLVGGFNRDTGVLDVVEASIRKRLPTIIINDVINLQEQYRCRAWGVETVQFQEFFASQMVVESAKRKIPVPVVGIKTSTDKELRIETIEPHVTNGLIRLHPRLVTLLEQLRHWPAADHDDGPDALEMLWSLVQSRTRRMGGFRGLPRAQQQLQSLKDYGVGSGGIGRGGRFFGHGGNRG
jgi:predicted phage terminase large subunit-like protein